MDALVKDVIMTTRKRNVPRRDDDFFNFQGNIVNQVVANKTAWGIPDASVNSLVARRTEYESLYHKSQNKQARTSGDVLAHRECRNLYEKEIRVFVNAHIRFNDKMTDSDRISVGLPPRDTEPSPRPKITIHPLVGLRILGGGDIEVTCRRETDETRPSMHSAADAIELRFIIVPVGEKPPSDPEQCPKTQISKKARFIISGGVKNAGQSLYGFFRWVNLTNPQNSGPWTTKALGTVIG